MSRFIAAVVAALLAFSIMLPAAAAISGFVRGTVTINGKPAPGATVVLEGEGSRFTTTSDVKGEYVFAQVPFGSYRLTASAKGAQTIVVSVNVASGQVARVNLALST